MKIAFVIYNGMTTLDFAGVFDPVTRLRTMGFLPDLDWDACATIREVTDGSGLRVAASRVCGPFDGYDMVVVPGGFASRELVHDADMVGWLRTAERCRYRVSVCTGALLWGACGFLQGRPATTHPSAFKLLEHFGARVLDERIVDDGDIITARGVTSSVDLGLYLCEKLAGAEARRAIAAQMDYPYGPYGFGARGSTAL